MSVSHLPHFSYACSYSFSSASAAVSTCISPRMSSSADWSNAPPSWWGISPLFLTPRCFQWKARELDLVPLRLWIMNRTEGHSEKYGMMVGLVGEPVKAVLWSQQLSFSLVRVHLGPSSWDSDWLAKSQENNNSNMWWLNQRKIASCSVSTGHFVISLLYNSLF